MMMEVAGKVAEMRSVVAMPSMPGMLMSMSRMSGAEPPGQLDGLLARRRRADDLDVRLEGQQLGQVLSRLGDVVDDDDADLFGHARFLMAVRAARPRRVLQGSPPAAESASAPRRQGDGSAGAHADRGRDSTCRLRLV